MENHKSIPANGPVDLYLFSPYGLLRKEGPEGGMKIWPNHSNIRDSLCWDIRGRDKKSIEILKVKFYTKKLEPCIYGSFNLCVRTWLRAARKRAPLPPQPQGRPV